MIRSHDHWVPNQQAKLDFILDLWSFFVRFSFELFVGRLFEITWAVDPIMYSFIYVPYLTVFGEDSNRPEFDSWPNEEKIKLG
jgi:hypothetical protein